MFEEAGLNDHKNSAEYEALGVPTHIAKFLSKVAFEDGRALKIVFNGKAAGASTIMQRIREGLAILPYQPAICQLKSYTMSGNPNKTCIDLFAARD